VIQEIEIIKEKAETSESLVYEMCKDIKSLDIAKNNLTFSINSIKKYMMLLTAKDKLKEFCSQKNYSSIADMLSAFEELSKYIIKY
jgi:hypothetical protein